MTRLFQFGAVMMLIGAFVPLVELFDRWDPPGPSNDTEYAVYALLLGLCLVLVLCKLIASAALRFGFLSFQFFLRNEGLRSAEPSHTFIFAVPPLFLSPLRI